MSSIKQLAIDTGIAEKNGISQETLKNVINDVVEVTKAELKEGNKVSFPSLCIFKPYTRPARKARNPQNGEVIQVPAKDVVKVKVSSVILK